MFDYSGQASFTPNSDLSDYVPVAGCDLRTLLSEARKRRIVWEKVRKIIPSLKSEFALNHEAIDRASLPASHRAHLEKIVSCGNTIETISKALSQDALEISKRLVPLIKKGLLVVKSAQQTKRSEIVIVDDSQLMLQMFQTIVSSWGYGVRAHSDPTSALNVILNADPAAIFLGVNMPDISGFDLLKQIRRQPTLADVPLIMLTAERTLSNNWRAQWSGCNFLSKPLSPEEFPNFKLELRMLLEAIAS
ncbi:MAG: PleD family two-component system response regulator [Elainellaceae cyanobacterium]